MATIKQIIKKLSYKYTFSLIKINLEHFIL